MQSFLALNLLSYARKNNPKEIKCYTFEDIHHSITYVIAKNAIVIARIGKPWVSKNKEILNKVYPLTIIILNP